MIAGIKFGTKMVSKHTIKTNQRRVHGIQWTTPGGKNGIKMDNFIAKEINRLKLNGIPIHTRHMGQRRKNPMSCTEFYTVKEMNRHCAKQ